MTHRYKGQTVTIDRHEPDGSIRIRLPGGRTKQVDPSELEEARKHSPPVRHPLDGLCGGCFGEGHTIDECPHTAARERARPALVAQPKPKTPRSRSRGLGRRW